VESFGFVEMWNDYEAMSDDEATSGLGIAEPLYQSSNGDCPTAADAVNARGGWLGAGKPAWEDNLAVF
jgi:hypothetical protein